MRNVAVLAIFLSALTVAACDEGRTSAFGTSSGEAEFRARAHDLYASLNQPSCNVLEGFDRRDHLADEFRAIGQFETLVRATPAWSHLEVAREDAFYRLMRDDRPCWNDPTHVWAEKHLEMTKESVREILPQLEALAPSLRPIRIDGGLKHAAEFRYLVRRLPFNFSSACSITASVSNEEVMGPASNVVSELERELANTPFADQFEIAEADVAFTSSEMVFECAPPSTASAQQVSLSMESEARRQVAEIRALLTAE